MSSAFNTARRYQRASSSHIGGAQIDSDLSDRALVQEQGGHRHMAEVAFKRAPLSGASIRERLRSQDDAAVVTAFLTGEERAFQERVERDPRGLFHFTY